MSLKNSPNFSTEAKLEALRVLAINNYNFNATERQLNITRKTLKKWQTEFGEHPVIVNQQAAAINDIANKVVGDRVNVLKKVEEVHLKALDRALELLAKEKNLDKVTNLILALKEFSDANSNPSTPKKNTMTIAEKIERITLIEHE